MQTSGNYDVLRLIGQGPETVVHHAKSRQLLHDVAIRSLREDQRTLRQSRIDFIQRAQAWGKFQKNHEALIKITELDQDKIFVVEDLFSCSAAHFIRSAGIELNTATEILLRAIPALDAIHNAGFLHNNIKPSNLLFDQQNRVSLSDGYSVELGQHQNMPVPSNRMKYMAPELVFPKNFGPIGVQSDLYSLAFVILELLVGPDFDQTFHGGQDNDVTSRDMMWYRWQTSAAAKLPPVNELLRIEIQPVTRILDRMLQKEVGLRFQNSREILQELGLVPVAGKERQSQGDYRLASPQQQTQIVMTIASGARCGEELKCHHEQFVIGNAENSILHFSRDHYPEAADKSFLVKRGIEGWQITSMTNSKFRVNKQIINAGPAVLRSGDFIRFSEEGPDLFFVVRQSGVRDWQSILRDYNLAGPQNRAPHSPNAPVPPSIGANVPSQRLPASNPTTDHRTAAPAAQNPVPNSYAPRPPLSPHSAAPLPPGMRAPQNPASHSHPSAPLPPSLNSNPASNSTAVAQSQNAPRSSILTKLNYKTWDKNTTNWVILSVSIIVLSIAIILWPSGDSNNSNETPQEKSSEKSDSKEGKEEK